jgi:nucleoid DNA-binding protein
MTKEELVAAISARTGLNRRSSEDALEAALGTIADAVRDGDKVTLSGFGNFLLVDRAPRKARNPKTGEVVAVPKRKLPRFVPSKKFVELAK